MPRPTLRPESYQPQFERRWGHLRDPHVRDLAWLLDSPDLLDPAAPRWEGRIASLNEVAADTACWLRQLDADPAALHAALSLQPFTRLGRYAEQLMRFYLEHQGVLVAHGVQVRAGPGETIGEFDFLLRQGRELVHWEFATKFYLLESSGAGCETDYFVGPNLADTLGAKMRKIFERQLTLGQHPAAQPHLPAPLDRAQALVKGWLFYRYEEDDTALAAGVSARHCRGFWCEMADLASMPPRLAQILPRLSWLAPARANFGQALDPAQLRRALEQHFAAQSMPVLVALLEPRDDHLVEVERGFIVPNDWRGCAGQRLRRPGLPGNQVVL